MTDVRSLHGVIARTLVLPNITLAETLYSAGEHLPAHVHESGYFCLVLKGAFTESSRHQSRVCSAQTLIVHREDDRHSNQFHSAVRCFNVVLDSTWNARLPGRVTHGRVVIDGGPAPRLARRIYSEFRNMDDLSGLIVEGLTLEVLGEAARADDSRSTASVPAWLREAGDLLHDRFRENIALSDVAAAVGVHSTHLAREFRRQYRCTVGEYLRERRIAFACRLLAGSARALSAIAADAGFFDQSHFAKKFKQSVGVSPAEYRRATRSR